MSSRIAPWVDGPAATRLAGLEAALPGGARAALDAAVRALDDHAREVDADGLVLYAGTNAPSPLVAELHRSTLASRPSMGWPGAKYQAGTARIEELEVLATRAVAGLMRAEFAEVRAPSATIANLAVYTAVTRPGDAIATLPADAGGHTSHLAEGAPGVRGLRVHALPYDVERLDVDLAALPGFLAAVRPRLVVVGASLLLFPHRLEAIAGIAHAAGALVLYDASHVAGLLAGGAFQDPLREGADILTFSTYKSFGGPPGGVIATNDPALAQALATAVYPALTANYDAARLAPLTAAAVELASAGEAYARQCIANARALGAALHARGVPVLAADRGFTASHHLVIDGDVGALDASRIYASAITYPVGHDGVRLGTQELARRRFVAADMDAVADLLARALAGETVAADVAALRRSRDGLAFTLA
jgi:glycine hydroxymethyltransferase